MSEALVEPRQETPVDEQILRMFEELTSGLTLVAGSANICMQLSRRGVGRGVVESKVDSGRVDLHPIKRTRTTLTYLIVAAIGTPEELAWMREQVNKSHRYVRSDDKSPVRYSAFDPELQLWVAACLYKGFEDTWRIFYGEPSPETLERFYRHGTRLGTTLQVPPDRWPPDRAAFEEYWDKAIREIETDEETRAYLQDLARMKAFKAPVSTILGPLNRILTVGFLPQEFRDELGFTWNRFERAIFAVNMKGLVLTNRILPKPLRAFPFNVYLRDYRRRMRKGRSFV